MDNDVLPIGKTSSEVIFKIKQKNNSIISKHFFFQFSLLKKKKTRKTKRSTKTTRVVVTKPKTAT